MAGITERYSTSVHSRNLTSAPDTTRSDTDVLGAFGLAGKREALSVALMRLFAGDNHASGELVRIMSGMVWDQSFRAKIKITSIQADDIARAILAWHRDGRCKTCQGHGYQRIKGTPHLSAQACHKCLGTGKISLDRQFKADHVELARWLAAEVEREQGRAGPAAMVMLAPRLEL